MDSETNPNALDEWTRTTGWKRSHQEITMTRPPTDEETWKINAEEFLRSTDAHRDRENPARGSYTGGSPDP